MDQERERLSALNDPLLRPLIEARDHAAREAALETLFVEHLRPTIRKVLARFIQQEGAVKPDDADDVTSSVILELVRRLKLCTTSAEDAVERLPDYVATQTFNAVYDLMRSRFPNRMRLKSRIRYVLTHDPRFALWTAAAGPAAGLARFRDTAPTGGDLAISRASASAVMLDQSRPAEALFALFRLAGGAVRLDALVRTMAELWNVTDAPAVSHDAIAIADDRPTPLDRLEKRQYLATLWSEIRQLRGPQRAALLLNLRDVDGMNGMALFIVAGIATLEEIAEAVGLTAERCAELWQKLPLDDLTIASMLGLKRQQVINLRQAARDRLARRMSRNRRG
jgi:hypothetical protein